MALCLEEDPHGTVLIVRSGANRSVLLSLLNNALELFWSLHNFYMTFPLTPSIRKFKMLDTTSLCVPVARENVTLGLAYHSQNNDLKILRIENYKIQPLVAEVYTLSTDSWEQVDIPFDSLYEYGPDRLFGYIVSSPYLFLHGALHSIEKTPHLDFILAFDVNDEIFREIMLPQNYFDGAEPHFERLVVFKGSLALFAYGDVLDEGGYDHQVSFIW